MAVQVPAVRMRRLGTELRRMREKRGESGEFVAAAVGMSQPKITRMENGRGAKAEDVKTLLEYYQCAEELAAVLMEILRPTRQRGWWQGYADTLHPLYTDLITLEADASSIHTYEAAFVPGLLQTPDYTREIITKLNFRPDFDIEANVDVRTARQAVLTRPQKPLEVWAVIQEAALKTKLGPGIMQGQLDRLLQLARKPTINLQIMPDDASPHPGMNGAFAVLGFPQSRDLDLVLLSTLLDSVWVDKPADVELYRAKFTEVTAEALPIEASLAFITETRDRLTT